MTVAGGEAELRNSNFQFHWNEERIGLDFSIISGYEGRKLTHLLILMNFLLLVDRN